jgi:1,4-alpha-glucan branching enzyme
MRKRKVKEEGESSEEATRKPVKRKTTLKEPPVRTINLAVVAPDARSVSVVGDFNEWRIGSHSLQQSDDETWRITLQLAPGTYQYKFVIDGIRWEDDADNPNRTTNEFGTSNSILEVV